MIRKYGLSKLLFYVVSLLLSTVVQAAFVSPEGWVRGDSGSAYLEWQSFANAQVNTAPDIGSINIDSVSLNELVGQSFVASSGNLYSLNTQSYTMTVDTGADGPSILSQDVSVNLQISTWGNPVDTDSVLLNGQQGAATKIYEGPDDGTGNWVQIDYLISWNVAASGLYTFNFDLDQAHTSLSGLAVDMFGAISNAGLISLPNLAIFPPIPGHPLFNGSQLTVADVTALMDSTTTTTSSSVRSNAVAHTLSAPAVAAVPLPSSLVLLGSALTALIARKRLIK